MLVLRTSNFQGATIRPIVLRHKHSIVFIVQHSILNLKKKTDKNPFNTTSIVYFLYVALFTEKFSRTTTIHPGIFRGRALYKQ